MKNTKLARGVAVATVTAVIALILASCGSSAEDATSSDHNAQDVAFAQGMIPHHGQAIQMARMVSTRSSSAEIKDLASKIEAAQQPEIDTMNGWLKSWGESAVDPAAMMDHGMHGSSGMMSSDDMTMMQGLSDAAFDRMFLEGMIKHHEGAIDMAKTQQAKGKFEPAKTMAASIITSQQAEIDQMKAMLG